MSKALSPFLSLTAQTYPEESYSIARDGVLHLLCTNTPNLSALSRQWTLSLIYPLTVTLFVQNKSSSHFLLSYLIHRSIHPPTHPTNNYSLWPAFWAQSWPVFLWNYWIYAQRIHSLNKYPFSICDRPSTVRGHRNVVIGQVNIMSALMKFIVK